MSTFFALALVVYAGLLPRVAAAQVGSTTDLISGRVTNPAGQPIEGATVTATSIETRTSRSRTTNAKGQYTILFPDASKKTLGLVYPGAYEFNVGAKEQMDITAGTCRVRLAGESEFRVFEAGSTFHVPENSSFEIKVEEGIAQYVCSFG